MAEFTRMCYTAESGVTHLEIATVYIISRN